MIPWTGFVVRNRGKVLAAWAVLFVLGVAGASDVGHLLSNRFSVPGSDAERGLNTLKTQFGERSDGAFTLVLKATNGGIANPSFRANAQAAAKRNHPWRAGDLNSGDRVSASARMPTVMQ